VDSPNQFVPLGTTKKEFKKVQQAMKEGRRAGGITSGPESKILEGGGWEETRVLDDGSVVRPVTPGFGGYGGDQVDFKVGAASKGIIQRDFQHHATVFKSAYAKNPFDNVTAEELDEYRRIIDSKSRQDGDIPDSSTLENTTGDVMSPPPLPDDPVRGAMGILSPTSPTTDTEHTTGDCTNMTNNFLSYFSNNKLHTYFLILQPLVLRLSYGNVLKIFHWYLDSICP
jgi:adducin